MEKFVVLVSSNARKLYVEDIYRTMVHPDNYVIQFRYQLKYIGDEIRESLKKLKGKSSIIYYCYDPNSPSYKGTIKDDENGMKTYIPIRKATIKEVEVNKEIGQVNFYLQLHEFLEVELHENTSLPNPEFEDINLYEIDVLSTKKVSWIEKVENIKNYFGDINFVHLKNITGRFKIKYNSKEKRTNLHLTDDKSYVFELLTYDKTEGKGEVEISTDKSFINLNEGLEKGTKINSKRIPLDTRPIDFRRDRTYIEIKDCTSEFAVKLSVKLRKRLKRSIMYGILSSLALLSFQVSNLVIRDNLTKANFMWLLLAAVIVCISVTFLHWFHNKK